MDKGLKAKPTTRRDVKWADGIRGIASLLIVTSHCCRAFVKEYLSPANEYGGHPKLFQRPFLRLIAAGPFWTACFFILSGYVCAIKPLKLYNAGHADEARQVIGSSAFRRIPRIGIPATIATIMSWTLAQIGVYGPIHRLNVDSEWIGRTTPFRIPGFWPPILNLLVQSFNTWTGKDNWYELNQWTLCWEMRGSMLLFIILVMSSHCTPFWRRIFLLGSACYAFRIGEFMSPFCFISGALLADLSLRLPPAEPNTPGFHLRGPISSHWPLLEAFLGLLMASVPPDNPTYKFHSRIFWNAFEKYVTPRNGANDRVIAAVGAIMFIHSVLMSPTLQRVFSNRAFVFLGSISFALYLLHGTFIRGPLTWILFGFLPSVPGLDIIKRREDPNGGRDFLNLACNSFGCKMVVFPMCLIWLGSLLFACTLWKAHVDTFSMKASRWVEDVTTGNKKIEVQAFFVRTRDVMLKIREVLTDKIQSQRIIRW